MIDEKSDPTKNIQLNISPNTPLEDIERLVRGIERSHIIDMVKHSKYLQQRVFPGYRPDHLPWDRVPDKLARDVQAHPEGMRAILNKWLLTNLHLLELVKREVHTETIEDDVVKILANLDRYEKQRDNLFWALLLDGREEIQIALTNGLREDLIKESSILLIRVKQCKLEVELEKAKQDIVNLKAERDQLKLDAERIPVLQAEVQAQQKTGEQLEAQHRSEIVRRDKLLQEIKSERDTIQQELDVARQEMSKLQTELEGEQARNIQIQQNMDNLQNSLDTVIASQVQTSSAVKRQLHETLQLLEEERKVSASLRQRETNLQLSIEQAERERSLAYEKRDEARQRGDRLEISLQKAEVAQEKVVSEVRKIHRELEGTNAERNQAYNALSLSEEKAKSLLLEKQRLEDELQQTKVELDELFLHLADLEKKSTLSLDPTQIDTYWNKALETIAQHITLTLPLQTSTIQLVSADEKWRDWQNWQHLEITHIQPLLSSLHITAGKAKTLDLLHIESAQKLLMLRWYLLEWLKLHILAIMQADSRILIEAKENTQ